MVPCAVCGMDVDADDPPAESHYNGETYVFCCEACKEKFDGDPRLYADRAANREVA